MTVGTDRWLCGWRLRTEIPLPELLPWTGDDREPDVVVRIGPVAEPLADVVHEGRRLSIGRDGTCRLAVPDVATFRVTGGQQVVVAPDGDAEAPDVRLFLLGTVFGALCHQRGVLPLHAGCVRIGADTVAFAGPSGVGKSSLAAALWRRGCPLISDDVCVVSWPAGGGPAVLPAFPRLRLWHDGADALGLDPATLPAVRAGTAKYTVPVAGEFAPDLTPLAAVYHLSPSHAPSSRATLEPAAALAWMRRSVYRRRIGERRQQALLDDLARLAVAVPQRTLGRPATLADVGSLAEQLVAWHGGP